MDLDGHIVNNVNCCNLEWLCEHWIVRKINIIHYLKHVSDKFDNIYRQLIPDRQVLIL